MSRIDQTLKTVTLQLQKSLSARNERSHTSRLDAEILLCHVLDKTPSYLFTWPEKELDAHQQKQYQELIDQRAAGIPVAYLTGYREFWSLKLAVNPDVLIPRPDTELIVETALGLDIPATAKVADLGTGSGAIALAMASERSGWQVTGIDRFPAPVKTATENARFNNVSNVKFLQGSWCEPLSGGYHMIVSNPPYLRENDEHLAQGDVQFEPRTALTAGVDGLNDIRTISSDAPKKLLPGGWLLLEHGYDQGKDIRMILENDGYLSVETRKDLAGFDRVTLAQTQPSL